MRATIRWAILCIPFACGDSTEANTSRVASISFAQTSISISQGETRTIAVQFMDENGAVLTNVTNATWRSSNTALVDVDQQGAAKGLALGGPVNVTVSVSGESAVATITVIPERIRFMPSDSTVILGQTLQLSGVLEDHDFQPILTNTTIAWSSTNPEIATINATSGLLTSVASGNTTIRAAAAGRTTEKHFQIGVPSVYDGRWSGASAATPLSAGTVPITFEVIFGVVKNFMVRLSANSVCGPVSAEASGTPATIAADGFSLALNTPTPGTLTGTFTSPTQMSGTHTAFGWNTLAICPAQGGGFAVVGGGVPASTLTAQKQPPLPSVRIKNPMLRMSPRPRAHLRASITSTS